MSQPLTRFEKALGVLRKHADKGYHIDAVVKAEEFMKVMANQQPDICHRLSQALADRIASNHQNLASIFKTIEFCGCHNIALRGHCDNVTNIEKDPLDIENHGNFRALLSFRVDAGDTVLGDHLALAPRNATNTSSVIQNEVIDVLASQIRNKIIMKCDS